MRQLQFTGLVCFQKYIVIFGLLNMIFKLLCASPATNPSQSNIEPRSSSFYTDTASCEFSLKMISNNGAELRFSKRYSELATLIQSYYYHLQTALDSKELQLESDCDSHNFFHKHFSLKALIEINDSKSFCLAIFKVISILIQPCHFSPISSHLKNYDFETLWLYTAVYNFAYFWVYRNTLLRCKFSQEDLKNKEMVDSISKTIEEIFKFILMINPSSSSYLDACSNSRKHLGLRTIFNVAFNEAKLHIFEAAPFIKEMKSKTCFNRESWKWQNSENNKQISVLKKDYLSLCEQLHMPFRKLEGFGTNSFSLQLRRLSEMLKASLKKFEKSLTIVENIPESKVPLDHASIIEFCRLKLVYLKSYYSNFETTGKKYEELFEELDKILESIFDWSIKKALGKKYLRMKNISWVRELMLFQLYCWETAHIIESKPQIANSVADSVIEVLEQEDSICFNKFIRQYNVCLPGLVQSICDRKPLSSDETAKLLLTRNIIFKITHEKCGIQDLMNLYYAVQKEKLENNKIKTLVNDLLRKLSNEGIKTYDDIKKTTKACIPIMVYAVNILRFSTSNHSSSSKKFLETFKEVNTYTLNLQLHISTALNDSDDSSSEDKSF